MNKKPRVFTHNDTQTIAALREILGVRDVSIIEDAISRRARDVLLAPGGVVVETAKSAIPGWDMTLTIYKDNFLTVTHDLQRTPNGEWRNILTNKPFPEAN